MTASPWSLSWRAVEPARQVALSIDEVAEVALPAIPAERPAAQQGNEIEARIDAALQRQYGPWAAGWRWAGGEGSIGGGPVRGWCCPSHSVWLPADDGPSPTAMRAARGLLSWKHWISELGRVFDETSGGMPELERHAQRVLHLVVQRTGAEDAWYVHAEQVLVWLLESQGCANAGKRVAGVLKGRFESWCSPPASDVQEIAQQLSETLLRARSYEDVLPIWWRTREQTQWVQEAPGRASGPDGVLEYVLTHDAELDDTRGMRMLEAHERARAAARRGEALTWRELQRWQAIVLGSGADVQLRARDAWAKGGRERYERVNDLQVRVDRALREATDPAWSAVARAARVYLDLCFLHPFVDGNARAARLALDFVLVREGLGVRDTSGALFRVPAPGSDPEVGSRTQALLARLV